MLKSMAVNNEFWTFLLVDAAVPSAREVPGLKIFVVDLNMEIS